MSLFQCSKCGVQENTALTAGYLLGIYDPDALTQRGLDPSGSYCSACFTGKWHGEFPQHFYPLNTMETDHEGNLRQKDLGR